MKCPYGPGNLASQLLFSMRSYIHFTCKLGRNGQTLTVLGITPFLSEDVQIFTIDISLTIANKPDAAKFLDVNMSFAGFNQNSVFE